MKNTIKITKHKNFHGYNVSVSNGKQYYIDFNHEAERDSAWCLFECTDEQVRDGYEFDGFALTNASTKRELVECIKYWNNID